MENTKEKGKFRYSILFAIFQLIIGIVFLAIPEKLGEIFPYIITTYLLIMFLYELLVFNKKRDKKLLVESILYLILAVLLLLLFIFTESSVQIVAILMTVYCVLKAIKKLFEAIYSKGKKQKTSNFLGMFVHLLFSTSIIISLAKGVSSGTEYVVIYGAIYIFEALAELYRHRPNKNVLFKVAEKTHAGEIISGLILVMILASSVLPFIEPGIVTFGDAMWYCFAIVTTIGFGDMFATTTLGRMISVVVGIYGIIIVALITSIIVNIYEEQKSKDKSEKTENDKKDL